MTGWEDQVVADAVRRAEDVFAAQAVLGRLLWSIGSDRCFERQDGDDAVVTLVGAGGPLVYRLVGLDVGCLR